MIRKMTRAEVKAYADLAKAACRVQALEKRRKNASKKPKLTREQQQEMTRKRIAFAKSLNLNEPIHWADENSCEPWYAAAREAIRLGLYSHTNGIRDVALWLCVAWRKP